MKNFAYLIMFLVFVFYSCNKDEGVIQEVDEQKTEIGGTVQKGPFVSGSKVSVFELDSELNPTGKTYFTFIENDKGEFSLSGVRLESNYIEILVEGYYYNECTNTKSKSQITLSAIADVNNVETLYVNVLTHLIRNTVKKKMQNGISYNDAVNDATGLVMDLFHITELESDPNKISFIGNGKESDILMAISILLLYERTDVQLTEFLAEIIEDLDDNEKIDNPAILESVAETSLKLGKYSDVYSNGIKVYDEITNNVVTKYQTLGEKISGINFKKYIDLDNDKLVGENDNDDVSSLSFKEITVNSTEINSLYNSDEITLNSISGNVRVYWGNRLISGGKISGDVQYNRLISDIGIKEDFGDNLLLNDGSLLSKFKDNGTTIYNHYRSSFYLCVNGNTILSPIEEYSNIQSFNVKKGDVLKVIINPFHYLQVNFVDVDFLDGRYLSENELIQEVSGKTIQPFIEISGEKKVLPITFK